MDNIKKESIQKELDKAKLDSSIKRINIAYYLTLIFGMINIMLDIIKSGLFTMSEHRVLFFISYGTMILFNSSINKHKSWGKYFSFWYGEAINWALMYLTFVHEKECDIIWAQLTPLIIIYYQGYLIHTIPYMIGLSLKYTVQWTAASYYFSKLNAQNSVVMISAIIAEFISIIICLYLDHIQNLDLCTSKVKIKLANRKLKSLIEAIPQCISVISDQGDPVFINSTLKNLLVEENLTNCLKSSTYYNRYKQQIPGTQILEDIKNSFKLDLSTQIVYGITENKNELIEWTGKIDTWEESKVLILYGKNVTQLIKLEKENNENNYKSMLLRTVSHELRTPTNSMLVMAESLLESKELSEESIEKAKIITGSCGYLLCLINDLLDYSQIMAGSLKILKIPFNLVKLVHECLKFFEIELKKSNINAYIVFKTRIPNELISDPYRIKQIILNLLSNAKKFTNHGSITLEIAFLKPKLIISCIDTGIGIDSAKLSQIFTIFGKIENSSLNPQGVGLGLFISNMLVRKLGGSGLDVVSKLNEGSIFSFDIIAEPFEQIKLSSVDKEVNKMLFPALSIRKPINNLKILIVDDTYFNILAYTQILTGEGFLCEYAINGSEAIKKIMENEYDCILMDCEMPVMDGWQATQKLKEMLASGKLKILPSIIGVTAHNLESVKFKCIESGMDDIIIKPCSKSIILNKLYNCIEVKKFCNWTVTE